MLSRLSKLCFFILFVQNSFAQKATINWLSFEELAVNFKEEQKPILLFLHTDWCKYCKMQENTTFKDSMIISRLNKSVYAVKLNAETKDTVQFFERNYAFNQNSGFHELATYLGSSEGKLEFPTTIILTKSLEPIFRKNALVSIVELSNLLK